MGRHAQPDEGSAGAARQAAARGGASAARQAPGHRDRAHPRRPHCRGIAGTKNITEESRMRKVLVALAVAAAMPAAHAQSVKIGVVTFLSGPAAAPFGVPAKNAAEFVVEQL